MSVFICRECGTVFDVPISWEEAHGIGYRPHETWSGCPDCYGSYTTAMLCDNCDSYHAVEHSYHTNEHGTLCKTCYDEFERNAN